MQNKEKAKKLHEEIVELHRKVLLRQSLWAFLVEVGHSTIPPEILHTQSHLRILSERIAREYNSPYASFPQDTTLEGVRSELEKIEDKFFDYKSMVTAAIPNKWYHRRSGKISIVTGLILLSAIKIYTQYLAPFLV